MEKKEVSKTRERDYDGLIREGTYEIPVGSDMETIAKIITAQNE